MHPTDFTLTHSLLSEHLDALRREAAQLREVARRPMCSRRPRLFARLRQALARSQQSRATEREAGATHR